MAEEHEDDSGRLITFLDEAEKRVENLRSQALYMMEERASLLTILKQLKEDSLKFSMTEGDRQQFLANTERLGLRCNSVTVEVNTVRTEQQQNSLDKINAILDDFRNQPITDQAKYKKQLEIYYNTCQSEYCGAVDSRLQNLVLECTVDDQKQLRRRLDSWLQNLKHLPKVNGT